MRFCEIGLPINRYISVS